jgi:hypothetical protein
MTALMGRVHIPGFTTYTNTQFPITKSCPKAAFTSHADLAGDPGTNIAIRKTVF